MKIHFSNVNFLSASGPNTFMTRLAHEFSLQGHIIADVDDYDVALVCIEQGSKLLPKKPIIQRLDGVWFKNSHEFETKNVGIKSLYKSATAVVMQSDFDRQMTHHWWGSPNGRQYVIRNGIAQGRVNVTNETLRELRTRYDRVFVCSSNWHPQKRLRDNIELFKHLRSTQCPLSCLVVMGDGPDYVEHDFNVYYTGALPHQTCLEMYASADWMLHLAWLDHCPNVVVEALSQGCPVICASSGGTHELVRSNGIIIQEPAYGFELADYDSPPRVDVTQVPMLPSINVDASYLDIADVTKAYLDVFETAINVTR